MQQKRTARAALLRGCGMIGELVTLQLFWLLASLPLVTAGAARAALYAAVREVDEAPVRRFWPRLRTLLRPATPLWCGMLLAGAVLVADVWIVARWLGPDTLLLAPFVLAGILWVFALLWLGPVLATTEQGGGRTLIRALALALHNLPVTLFVLVVRLLPVAAVLWLPAVAMRMAPLFLLCGAAVNTWICGTWQLRKIPPVCPEDE